MKLPDHKTQILCTIGSASRSESMLKVLLEKGMNVVRLNFSHGTFEEHRETIRRIRAVVKDYSVYGHHRMHLVSKRGMDKFHEDRYNG